MGTWKKPLPKSIKMFQVIKIKRFWILSIKAPPTLSGKCYVAGLKILYFLDYLDMHI